jgi:hypothetical protein
LNSFNLSHTIHFCFKHLTTGVITRKEILPISRLNFGRTQLDTSSGVHTLGRFECSGQVAVTGMPRSCEDIWRIGHTLSGLYSVIGNQMVESVYCDLNKLPGESGKHFFLPYFYLKQFSIFNIIYMEKDFKNGSDTPM